MNTQVSQQSTGYYNKQEACHSSGCRLRRGTQGTEQETRNYQHNTKNNSKNLSYMLCHQSQDCDSNGGQTDSLLCSPTQAVKFVYNMNIAEV